MSHDREDAAQLDRAIDRLLRSRSMARPADEGELAATARLLRDALPRLHPRVGFEESLASRLAVAGRGGALPVGAEPTPIHARLATAAAAPDHAGERRRRGLVAGGAIASGVSLALPIAGAAIVMWRRSRSSGGIF